MTNALSNPYELTIDGISCKVSSYANGYFVANQDMERLHPVQYRKFIKGVFEQYICEKLYKNEHDEKARELIGIKVGQPKRVVKP